MVTWVTCVRRLRRSAGAWVAWVIIYTWVAWVKYIFAWVKFFLRGFLHGSKLFTWIQNFCVGQLSFTRRDYFPILVLMA